MAKQYSEVALMLHLKITDLDSGEYHELICIPSLNAHNQCTIGRSKGCHLVLNGPEVSRLQARIIQSDVQPEAYCLIEPGSKSDCYLNNQILIPDKYYKLNSSDSILLSNFFILVYRIDKLSQIA